MALDLFVKPTKKAIDTPLGVLWGRDCIFLDGVEYNEKNCTLELVGTINAALVSGPKTDNSYKYALKFVGVVYWEKYDIDGSDWDWVSSFEWRRYTVLLRRHSKLVAGNCKHFVVTTYDDVFEIICESFDLQIANCHLGGKT